MEDFSFPPRPLLVSVKSLLCTAGTNAGRLGQHQWPCPGGGSRDKMKRGLPLHESRSSSGTHDLKGTQTLRRFMALGLAVMLLPLGQTELFAQQYGPYDGQYPAYPQPGYGQPAYPQPQAYGQPAYPQSQYPTLTHSSIRNKRTHNSIHSKRIRSRPTHSSIRNHLIHRTDSHTTSKAMHRTTHKIRCSLSVPANWNN